MRIIGARRVGPLEKTTSIMSGLFFDGFGEEWMRLLKVLLNE
jgi:hypothetical protein